MFILPLGEALELQVLASIAFVEDFQFSAELTLEGVEELDLLTDAELSLGVDDLGDLVNADVAGLGKHK